MNALFRHQAKCLNQMINARDEAQAHIYLEQLMLLPVDVQDKIIEDISQLKNCNSDAVANIIGYYSIMDLK